MGALEGRIAAITGAGRGIGREHALLFAAEGAKVVVNDLGGSSDGSGSDIGAAQEVVNEIVAKGGEAVAHTEDISSWDGAASLVSTAVEKFDQLDILVNNAGILRDSYITGMDENQWDSVLKVHLKGHFCTVHHAANHWRERSKAGEQFKAAIVNTASGSGTYVPNAGQANYGAAKAGIAALTQVASMELDRYGVRANAIAPVARTRLTEDVPMIGDMVAPPEDPNAFDAFDPANISPLVAYLATEDCPINGKLFAVQGGMIGECTPWELGTTHESEGPWTVESVKAELSGATV